MRHLDNRHAVDLEMGPALLETGDIECVYSERIDPTEISEALLPCWNVLRSVHEDDGGEMQGLGVLVNACAPLSKVLSIVPAASA